MTNSAVSNDERRRFLKVCAQMNLTEDEGVKIAILEFVARHEAELSRQ